MVTKNTLFFKFTEKDTFTVGPQSVSILGLLKGIFLYICFV